MAHTLEMRRKMMPSLASNAHFQECGQKHQLVSEGYTPFEGSVRRSLRNSPDLAWLEVSFNGSNLGNQEPSGIGGILGDENGLTRWAFSSLIRIKDSNKVEVRAILLEIRLLVRREVDNLLVEVFVNGKVCKDPKLAQAGDFFFSSGLDMPSNTTNQLGSNANLVTVAQIAGLNTLGISIVRIDYALNGLIPPHTHPWTSEILVVIEGTLYAGFVTSDPENRLISKVLNKGDVFVSPIGLIHFQFNVGQTNAIAIAGLSSQNPGIVPIANSVFGSTPPISNDVLAKAFQLGKNVVDSLKSKFSTSS
ncbi:putative germin-like protein 2-3 [Tasmannia lanceolata]|uniref:putative germin-like protein 2-3 n=1 Tax=Tasmannia lanceolata TaxID=3420 RepID=UPI0040632311